MAGSVNKVILVGNLGRDPEVRSFQNGGKVCNFSIATSESWKDKQTGEQREQTEWHNIVMYDRLAEIAAEFNRYNRVQLIVEGEAANLRLSGNFDTENVEAFARLAHEGLGLRLERDGDRIVLSGH